MQGPHIQPIFSMIPPGYLPTQNEAPAEPLDPEVLYTREQLHSLLEVIDGADNLTRTPNRGEEGHQPTVMVPNKQTADAATAIIMHASNRIIDILQDDTRWKPSETSRPLTKAEIKVKAIREETAALQERQELTERQSMFRLQEKINRTKATKICKAIETGEVRVEQVQAPTTPNTQEG